MTVRSPAPALDLDLYADDVLRDSREAFARICEAGPVVWLPRDRMYAMGRFDDVRTALRNDDVFRSGAGVAADPLTNRLGRAERFGPHRDNLAHVGWGNGPHTRVGIHLTKCEMHALLRAMAPRVHSIDPGNPTRILSNTLQGIGTLPATFQR